jgi:hypothetical protein
VTPLILGLTVLGLCDLISGGLGGQPRSLQRSFVAVVLGALAAVALIATTTASGLSSEASTLTLLVIVSTLLFWNAGRQLESSLPPIWPLLAILAGLAALAMIPLAPPRAAGSLDANAEVLSILGCSVFLAGTANSLVRAILQTSGTPFAPSSTRFRGGRIIGLLERLLIFGLALAGELTAATLIASAKSLLRFPELSQLAKSEAEGNDPETAGVDELTEYFLVGSLASWSIALLVALIAARFI